MKKLSLLVVLCFAALGVASAQSYTVNRYESKFGHIRRSTPIQYRGEAYVGYSVGIGDGAIDRFNVHTIHGVQIGDYFSTGLGTGVDIYFEDGETGTVIPVFLNLKGYLPLDRDITPYLSFDVGGGFGVGDAFSGLSGFMCAPAVGVQWRMFQAQLGYTLQQFSESGLSLNMGALQLKIGVNF